VCTAECLGICSDVRGELCLDADDCGAGEECGHDRCYNDCEPGTVCPAVCYGMCRPAD
jgi:hypothetical protein